METEKELQIVKNQKKNYNDSREVTFTCKKCGKDFTISIGNLLWFHQVGNLIPTHCKECTENKKKYYNEENK